MSEVGRRIRLADNFVVRRGAGSESQIVIRICVVGKVDVVDINRRRVGDRRLHQDIEPVLKDREGPFNFQQSMRSSGPDNGRGVLPESRGGEWSPQ